jgi:hypothetical protein
MQSGREHGHEERRESVRITAGARVGVRFGRQRRVGQLRNLSRFGAFVCCDDPPEAGARVTLVLDPERALAAGHVAYRITPSTGARLGTPTGIGIRFDAPLGACIATPRSPAHAGDEPTRRMVPPVLSELTGACRAPEVSRFTGELAEVGVPYLLAMVERTQRSCRLRLTRAGETATIDVAEGHIVAARLSSHALPADEVVRRAMRWTSGTFAMAPPEGRVRVTATKSIAQHLLDFERGAAWRDDHQR